MKYNVFFVLFTYAFLFTQNITICNFDIPSEYVLLNQAIVYRVCMF